MHWLLAALLLAIGPAIARADIMVVQSRYADGMLTVIGQTEGGRTVTLDRQFETEAGPDGRFRFHVNHKPESCMSDLRAGSDVYSAVIAGCFGVTTDGAEPKAEPPR